MKTLNLNANNKKKLELKKMAVANLTISEEKMKAVIGGKGEDTSGKISCDLAMTCTSTILGTI
jgi:hypothetical protein